MRGTILVHTCMHVTFLQDTSVLSPMIAIVLQVPVVALYSLNSPGSFLQTNSILLLSALALPLVKSIINMMVGNCCNNNVVYTLAVFHTGFSAWGGGGGIVPYLAPRLWGGGCGGWVPINLFWGASMWGGKACFPPPRLKTSYFVF